MNENYPMLGGIMGQDIGRGGRQMDPLVINIPSDFPTVVEANRDSGRIYIIGTAVTDNDPAKTNTSQSFLAGEEIVWNGTNYTELGSDSLWIDDGTDIRPASARNIELTTKGLKDSNVTTAVLLGSATDTSFDTTKKDIIGAVNEVKASIPTAVKENIPIGIDGDTIFTLLTAVIDPNSAILVLDHTIYEKIGIDFNVSGTTLTWLDPDGVTLKTTDQFTIMHNNVSAPAGTKSIFYTADQSTNLDNYRARAQGSGALFRYTGRFPSDLVTLTKIVAIGLPNASAAGTGKDIDIFASWAQTGELLNANIGSDTTSLYDTGTVDTFFELDLTSVFVGPFANRMFGVAIDNNIGSGTIYYFGILLEYT